MYVEGSVCVDGTVEGRRKQRRLGTSKVVALIGPPRLQLLTVLNIRGLTKLRASISAHLKYMTKLISLNLSCSFSEQDGVLALGSGLKDLPQLTALDLSYRDLGEDAAPVLTFGLRCVPNPPHS